MNQVYFTMAEGIGTGTGQKFISGNELSFSQFNGMNAEEFDTLVDLAGDSIGNEINFNYASHRAGVAGLRACRFGGSATNNHCDFRFLNSSANFNVVDDANTATDTPNIISGFIGSDTGTASASTSGATFYRDIKGYGTLDTNLAPNGAFGRFDTFGQLRVNGTTTTSVLNVLAPATATSTAYIYSKTAGKGGQIILEDTDGAGCTGVTALNGVLTAATVTCPTEI
jgi:hypothetical protein